MELTVLRNTTASHSYAVRLSVYGENLQKLTGIEVVGIVHPLGPKPAEAVLELTLDSFHRETRGGVVSTLERRMESVQDGRAPVRMDQSVWIGLPLDDRHVLLLFCGRITDQKLVFNGKSGKEDERVHLVARDVRHELEGRQVLGQYFHSTTDGRQHVDLTAIMNPGGIGNRDGTHIWQEGGSIPLFDETGTDAVDWTAGEALRYILGHYGCEENLHLPTEGLRTEALSASLAETVLEGDTCVRALWRILGTGSLDAWVDPMVVVKQTTHNPKALAPVLHVVDPASATVRDPQLDVAGATFSPESCELQRGNVNWSSRRVRNQWCVQGTLKEYEASFELVGLWTSDEQTTVEENAHKGRRGHEGYDPKLDHVYRQWGLNEDGHWDDQSTYDFSDLFSDSVKRRRRFLPPFRTAGDEVRTFVVEIQSNLLGSGWHPVGSAPVRLLADRAGIYFDCEDVDGARSGLRAGTSRILVPLQDISMARLTAVVQSDERVAVTSPRTDASGTELVLEQTVTDESFHWRHRDESSIYSADGTGLIEDDSAEDGPMQKRADALHQQHQALDVNARLSIPWIDLTWRPGVRVSRIAGRDIDLRAGGGGNPDYPLVTGVAWDFLEQTTTLILGPVTESNRETEVSS